MSSTTLAFFAAHALGIVGPSPVDAAVTAPVFAQFQDLTGDGIPDRLSIDADGTLHVSVHFGARRFVEIPQELPRIVPAAMLIEDLDGDLLPDMYFVTDGAAVALRGIGQGRFEVAADSLGLADPGPGTDVAAVDLDGDGTRDIVLRNCDEDVVFWRELDGSFTREGLGRSTSVMGLAPIGSGSSATASIGTLSVMPIPSRVPTGAVLPFAGTTPPAGFLLCDGSAVNRATFQRLFAVIGTTYGIGDGSTTFDLPDLRQRFLLGLATTGTGSVLGEEGGAIDHVHTVAAHVHGVAANSHEHGLNNHTHSLNGHTHSIPAHFHSATGPGADINILVSSPHVHDIGAKDFCEASGGSNRFMTANGTGTNAAHNAGTGSTPGSDGSHPHDHASFAGRVGTVTGGINGDIPFLSAGPSVGSSGGPSVGTTLGHAAFNTNSGGGGDTGASNPPYLAVQFIIKT